jgi:hypothetical protein
VTSWEVLSECALPHEARIIVERRVGAAWEQQDALEKYDCKRISQL